MRDWRNPEDYRFARSLSADQWAWEFLRRNPVYRKAWHDFIATWRALEAAYGKTGQRDVQAWKRDPRATVPAAECSGSDCRIEGERVLIECALGAQWGFYKFPPDPADDDPVGGGRLVWREVTWETGLLEPGQACPASAQTAAVAFDLGLPLAPQLEQAKRRLQIEQRRRIERDLVAAPRIEAHVERLCRLLRLLDGAEAGADAGTLALATAPDPAGGGTAPVEMLEQAQALRDGGYRRLLLLK
ncbi:MAG: DUF6499 domain-containing protein [Candidatus Thiodiazotropha sp.]